MFLRVLRGPLSKILRFLFKTIRSNSGQVFQNGKDGFVLSLPIQSSAKLYKDFYAHGERVAGNAGRIHHTYFAKICLDPKPDLGHILKHVKNFSCTSLQNKKSIASVGGEIVRILRIFKAPIATQDASSLGACISGDVPFCGFW